MQISRMGIFLGAWLFLSAPVYFGFQSYFKNHLVQESVRSVELQNLQLSRTLESTLRSTSEQVALFGSSFAEGSSYNLSHPMGRFELVGEVQRQQGQWQFVKTAHRQDSKLVSVASSLVALGLKNVDWSDNNDFSTRFGVLSGAGQKKLSWLLTRVKSQAGVSSWYLALSDRDLLRGALETFLGQEVEVFMLNDSLDVLSHSNQSYRGLKARDSALLVDLKNSSSLGRALRFKDQQEMYGVVHKIANANLFLVAQVKESVLNQSWATAQKILMAFVFAFLVCGVLVVYLIESKVKSAEFASLQQVVPVPLANVVSKAVPSAAKASSAAKTSHELIQLASSISREISLSQVGVSSLLKNMMHSQDYRELGDHQKNWIEQVAKSVEETRLLSENLRTFAGEAPLRASQQNLKEIFEKLLRLNRARFLTEGIECTLNCSPELQIETDERLLLQVLQTYTEQAVISMRSRNEKTLQLVAQKNKSQIAISLKDSGAGFSDSELEKLMNPFTDLKATSINSRFGIIQGLGIIRELEGEIEMKSTLGTGTEVTLKFPETLIKLSEAQGGSEIPAVVVAEKIPIESNLDFMSHQAQSQNTQKAEPSLFVNHDIEKLLEGIEGAAPAPLQKPSQIQEEKTQVLNPIESINEEDVKLAEVSSPQFSFNKKVSIIDDVEITVRRPGEKMTL